MRWFRRTRNVGQQASEWFVQVRSGRVDSHMNKEWASWMEASEDHARACEDRELTWELAEELRDRPVIQALLHDVDKILRDRQRPAVGATLRGRILSWQAGLAVLLLAIGISSYFLANQVSVNEYATAIGEQRIVTLADSSVITLNTGARIRTLYSRARRRVELLEGEALFSVSHDASRHFEVAALKGVTVAVGTQFDVQVEGSATVVSVMEGTVTVAANTNDSSVKPVAVSAGQAVDYTRDGAVSAIRPADAIRIRGWQAQRIVFRDKPLAQALQEYNRYIKVPIVLGSSALATRRINGVFRIGDEDAFLGALQQGLHVEASSTSDGQTLLQQVP